MSSTGCRLQFQSQITFSCQVNARILSKSLYRVALEQVNLSFPNSVSPLLHLTTHVLFQKRKKKEKKMTQHILKSLLSSSYAAYRYIDKFRIKAIMQRSPSLNNPPSRITVNNQNHEASIYYMQYFYNKSKPVAF